MSKLVEDALSQYLDRKLNMQTKAEIIAHTSHPKYKDRRIVTFQLTMPRYLLAELNTHRLLVKSAESSRAIPVKKRIEMVRNHPYIPYAFLENKPGMQADKILDKHNADMAREFWEMAAKSAAAYAESLEILGVHKQQANRILEPFSWVRVCVTATEWDNFFKLRASHDADPEFEILAREMKRVLADSRPKVSKYHLPYVEQELQDKYSANQLMKISAARCARISYKPFTESKSSPEKDLELVDKKLIPMMHLGPFDHPATAANWRTWKQTRQYHGWLPYRVDLEKREFPHVVFNSKDS